MSTLFFLNPLGRSIMALDTSTMQSRTVIKGLDSFPDGLILDPRHGYFYWTNMGVVNFSDGSSYGNDGSIERCRIDGSDRSTIIPVGNTRTPKQITADWDNNTLYWCDREGLRIWRSRIDGSEQELLLERGSHEHDRHDARLHCVGITLDLAHSHLYWTQKGTPKGGVGTICRMNMNIPAGQTPQNRDDIEVLWKDLPEPIDLLLHPESNTLYWTDRGKEPLGNTLNSASLPASGHTPSAPTVLLTGCVEAIGLDLDSHSKTLYCTDLGGNIHYYSLETSQGGLLTHIDNAILTGICVNNE